MEQAAQVETLASILARHALERPNVTAVTTPDASRTYAELAHDVAKIAQRMRDAGLVPGDRVALLARNGLAYVQMVYAASWSGISLVCLNWRLEREEVEAVLEDCGPSLLLAQTEFQELISDREALLIDSAQGGFEEWYSSVDAPAGRREEQGAEDVVLLLYTTGTTGAPKGVQLIERGLWHMCAQATVGWAMGPGTRFLACLPLFHVSGMSSAMCAVHMCGEVVVPTGTGVREIGSAIAERRVTHTTLVPTVLTGLVAENAANDWDLSSLEVVIYGSAPSGSSLIEEAMAMLPEVGFSQGYGLTETCAGVAIAPIRKRGEADEHPGSVGQILDNCECRIVDPHTQVDVGPGIDGEIWLRTPQLTPGYWQNPALTATAIDADGWFRTGDIGVMDKAGFLYIRDRLKDMIISGGENIYSVEVENAITAHPAVLETAVVGIPHPHWGETVKAIIVLRSGQELDGAGLRSWLNGRLAKYKRPRIVEFVAELPKTGSGKILKRALRAEAVS